LLQNTLASVNFYCMTGGVWRAINARIKKGYSVGSSARATHFSLQRARPGRVTADLYAHGGAYKPNKN
jgi:hypothetical protein